MKDHVFTTNPTSIEDLKATITAVIQSIDVHPLWKVFQNMTKWAKACLSVEGGHFEHLLWIPTALIPCISSFSYQIWFYNILTSVVFETLCTIDSTIDNINGFSKTIDEFGLLPSTITVFWAYAYQWSVVSVTHSQKKKKKVQHYFLIAPCIR